MYIRKTIDCYYIFSNYGYGRDLECNAENYADARNLLKTYRENVKNASFKIVKKREKITGVQ